MFEDDKFTVKLPIPLSGKESVTCSRETRATSLVSNYHHDMSLDDSTDDIRQAPDNKERALSRSFFSRKIDMCKITNNIFDFQSFTFNLVLALINFKF